MTIDDLDSAQSAFAKALSPGPSTAPAALEPYFRLDGGAWTTAPDLDEISRLLTQAFPRVGRATAPTSPADATAHATWEAATRWLLTQLRAWTDDGPAALDRLSLLLVALHALDCDDNGLVSNTPERVTPALLDGLARLVERTEVALHSASNRHGPDLEVELGAVVRTGRYERLDELMRLLLPDASPALWPAIQLIWKHDAAALSNIITARHEVLFSMMVCQALGEEALGFALQVPLVLFKFVAIWHRHGLPAQDIAPSVVVELLRLLLLQVAPTYDWDQWMRAFFKYGRSKLLNDALARTLNELSESQWTAFIWALSIGHSGQFADALALMMQRFSQDASLEQCAAMLRLTFERWSKWDCYKAEQDAHMFEPAACVLDYPVAMHYAQLPSAELDKHESELADALTEVEHTWFASLSDLLTQRNRLMSRQRLVSHGRAVAAGASAWPLKSAHFDAEDSTCVQELNVERR